MVLSSVSLLKYLRINILGVIRTSCSGPKSHGATSIDNLQYPASISQISSNLEVISVRLKPGVLEEPLPMIAHVMHLWQTSNSRSEYEDRPSKCIVWPQESSTCLKSTEQTGSWGVGSKSIKKTQNTCTSCGYSCLQLTIAGIILICVALRCYHSPLWMKENPHKWIVSTSWKEYEKMEYCNHDPMAQDVGLSVPASLSLWTSHRDAPESRGCQPQAFKLQSQGMNPWIQCTLHRLVLNTSVLQDSLFQHFRFSFQLPPPLLKYQLGSFVERGAGKSGTSVLCPKNGVFPLTIICWPSDFFRLGLQSQDPLLPRV